MKIYMIRDGENRYKIGYSKHTQIRLKQLQTAGATKYEIIHAIDCDPAYKSVIENTIHRYLASYRREGEWFELPDEYIKTFPELVRKVESNIKLIAENSTLTKPF